jgi:aspartyl-tRNA synthetase
VLRTHNAGTLRAEQAGQTVTLTGWVARRRDHGGVIFIDLRDASGVAQVVFREGEMAERAHALRSEFCVKIVGEVAKRPEGNANAEIPTGEIEVLATQLEVLSEAAPLPFPIDDRVDVGEEIRLKHRYLDLRRSGPAAAMRLRSEVSRAAREVLHAQDFVEIETPTMTRSTPEGARDFLVPARLKPGSWYALPQSPQLFKQLLMVGGLERYYQIARCFRDEDFRADRQPEFTQLDVEMSFVDEEDVYELGETVFTRVFATAGIDLVAPFRRMTYSDAMDRFGTDKPDVRFGLELVELTSYFAATPFRVFQAPYIGAVVMPGGASQPRREFDRWQEWARSRGARGLAYVTVGDDGTLGGPVAKNLSETERAGLATAVGAEAGDCVFFAAGVRTEAQALLGAVRNEVGRRCGLIDESRWEFLWITDMPMFEPTDDGGWTAVHHPFTAPAPEFEETFQDNPGAVPARAYDLVLNGYELVSGSIRIHRSDLQQRVFEVIGLSKDEAESKFGFLLEAFQYGPPPHGGLAVGLDRVCALLSGTDSIRDVIAFPKTASGGDPHTGAPTPVSIEQLRAAGVVTAVRAANPTSPSAPTAPASAALPTGTTPPPPA